MRLNRCPKGVATCWVGLKVVRRCAVIPETTIGGQRVPLETGTPGKLGLERVRIPDHWSTSLCLYRRSDSWGRGATRAPRPSGPAPSRGGRSERGPRPARGDKPAPKSRKPLTAEDLDKELDTYHAVSRWAMSCCESLGDLTIWPCYITACRYCYYYRYRRASRW